MQLQSRQALSFSHVICPARDVATASSVFKKNKAAAMATRCRPDR
jgi:hypothetical protein